MKSSLRILYVTACWPHGRTFGGQLRTLHIGRALRKLGPVTIAVVSSDEPTPDNIERTAEEFTIESPIRVNVCRNRGIGQRFQWAFNPRFLNVHGCLAEDRDRDRLLKRLDQFDLIWLSNSRTPNILNQWHWPRSILDIDDVPSTFQRTVWRNGARFGEKLKAGITMLLLKRRERFFGSRFNVLSVCSEADRDYLGSRERCHVIPNGFERPTHEPFRNCVSPPRIGFIGLYSYLPNLGGMRWFLRECWPLVKQQIPDARLRLVGKDTNGSLQPTAPDVDTLGYVAEARDEIATWSAMIVPVFHGAGTRVKIADAFSRKCPVVSTRFGAFGYAVESQRELLLADSPAAFAAACVALIRDREAAAAMAERAYATFLRNWTWDAIAPRIWNAAEDALKAV